MLDEDDLAADMSQAIECAWDDMQMLYEAGGADAVARYLANINAHGLYEYEVEVVLMPDKNAMN